MSPNDINPRFGAEYEVFGTGRTSLKASLGRYPTPDSSYGWRQQPAFRVSTNTNRAWNDANGDFTPDCVLLNPAANGECGAWQNQNFGKYVVSQTYDPNVLSGWNVREYSWDLSVGVQHELAPRVSTEITYVRRSWGNQTITDNHAVSEPDFDRVSIMAPVDSRLPNGGGYVVDGLYEVKADKFGQVDNFVTHAKSFGDGRSENYNGVDITVNARLQGGLQVQGGLNIGQSAQDDCGVSPVVPESRTAFGILRTPEQFCDIASGHLTSFGGLATYIVPKIDVQIAGTVQSRPYAGGNFPGIASQSLIANVLTLNNVQTYNPFTPSTWLQPTSLVSARFAKLSVQFDW